MDLWLFLIGGTMMVWLVKYVFRNVVPDAIKRKGQVTFQRWREEWFGREVQIVWVLMGIFVIILGGMFAYALIVGHFVQLALGVQIGTLVWIGTAIAGTIVGVGLYGRGQLWWSHSARLVAAFGAPPLIAAVIFGLPELI